MYRRVQPRPASRAQIGLLFHLHAQLGKPEPERPGTAAAAHAAIEHAKRLLAARPLPPAPESAPTQQQLHDLAVLAKRAGEPMPNPLTSGEAARELQRLRPKVP